MVFNCSLRFEILSAFGREDDEVILKYGIIIYDIYLEKHIDIKNILSVFRTEDEVILRSGIIIYDIYLEKHIAKNICMLQYSYQSL
jgi:hypothetical protein